MRVRTRRWATLAASLGEMPEPDFDTARQFQSAAEDAMRTGDFEALVVLLAPDVECVTPQHSLQGVEALTLIRQAKQPRNFPSLVAKALECGFATAPQHFIKALLDLALGQGAGDAIANVMSRACSRPSSGTPSANDEQPTLTV